MKGYDDIVINYDIRTTAEWQKFKESEKWMTAEYLRLIDSGINPDEDKNWQALLNKFEKNVAEPLHKKQEEIARKYNLILPEINQRYTIKPNARQNAA
jgi:hypothetical protein